MAVLHSTVVELRFISFLLWHVNLVFIYPEPFVVLDMGKCLECMHRFLQQLHPDHCFHCCCPSKSIVDGLNGNSKRQLTEAAGRKVNPKHPSDLDAEEEPSNKVVRHMAGTVKTEGKAFDTAEECRRILMLQGGEKGEEKDEDNDMEDKVKWEPQNRNRKVKKNVHWVRKQDEQLNGSKFEYPDNFTEEMGSGQYTTSMSVIRWDWVSLP